LQAEKRRLDYESVMNHNLINYFTRDSFDAYGITLIISEPAIRQVEIGSIEEFFQKGLQKLEEEYDSLHSIANGLVANNAQPYACILYDQCKRLTGYVKYYRRVILEGDATDWKPEFIFLHQTTACNMHDEFEKKEESIGYKF